MVAMPALDRSVLDRREKIVASLREIVPGEGVIANEIAMRPYESDGLTAYRQLPMVVVLPETADERSRELMREFGRLNSEDVRRDLQV